MDGPATYARCLRTSSDERREDMNNLVWTIFAVIGIIVVIGWILGR
jgi:hypothetical protein